MSKQKIIDFRVRPLYKNYLSFTPEAICKARERFGYEVTESLEKRDVETLVRELREAGVVKAVVPSRALFGTTNEELFELQDQYPDLFVVFPHIDIENREKALGDIDEYIINGRGAGAVVELHGPFINENTDEIYQKLEEHHIPVMITASAWNRPLITNSIPRMIDEIATKFPRLVIVVAHAGWPWVNEMVAITYLHPNLYLLADFEPVRGVGSNFLREGARYMASRQVLFGSSYPLGPVEQGIQSIRDWNLPKEIEEDILYNTAAKILNL